jgi:hypothetical protein
MMREIRSFGTITEVIELPNLTNIQITSYDAFLQRDVAPTRRENSGLQAAFREVFPIDETERGRQTGLVLDFLEYTLEPPEFTPDECREKDLTYHAGLFAKLQLVHKDTGLIKEDQVFLGDLPLMTEDGSFVINGADRVIVSQIHRSPGVYFTAGQPGVSGRRYTASIIPMPKRGPWIELEFDNADALWMKVNKRKFPFTLMLRVLGYGDERIREVFAGYDSYLDPTFDAEEATGITPDEALLRLFTVLRPGDPPKVDKATTYLHSLLADPRRYDLGDAGRYKLNAKLDLQVEEKTLLGFVDGRFVDYGLLPTLKYLVALQAGEDGRLRGRHRPPRQPAHPHGGRAGRRPDPRRARAHGPWRARADAARQPGRRHPAEAGQQPADRRRAARVLRAQPAVAVQGPGQPALRAAPQAPHLGPRAGRPHPRARRLRRPRRAPHALRPHLPDRDPRGRQHRPDHLARQLLARQRPRLHRGPVPARGRRPRHDRGRLHDRPRGGPLHDRAGEHAARRRTAASPPTRSSRGASATPCSWGRPRSTSWTSRRSRSSRCRPP